MLPAFGLTQWTAPVSTFTFSILHSPASPKKLRSTLGTSSRISTRKKKLSSCYIGVATRKGIIKEMGVDTDYPSQLIRKESMEARINRLVFELAPALPIAPWERPALVSKHYVYNFAFGANLKMDVLAARGGGIEVLSVDAGKVVDYRLAFFDASAATVEPSVGSVVHGLLLKMPRYEYEILYKTEGSTLGPFRPYREEEVTVETYGGETVQAVAFRASPLFSLSTSKAVVPNLRYLNLIREGAREMKLDPAYVAWLDGLVSGS